MERRPFLNYSMLDKYIGKHASIIGKVSGINSNGNNIKIQMNHGMEVNVALRNSLSEEIQGIVAVTGKVEGSNSFTADQVFSLGSEDMDFNMYNEAVTLSSRYPQLFSYTEKNGSLY